MHSAAEKKDVLLEIIGLDSQGFISGLSILLQWWVLRLYVFFDHFTIFFETVLLTEPGVCQLSKGYMTTSLWDLSVSVSPALRLQAGTHCHAQLLSVGSGD